jgi:hypothetical protein
MEYSVGSLNVSVSGFSRYDVMRENIAVMGCAMVERVVRVVRLTVEPVTAERREGWFRKR